MEPHKESSSSSEKVPSTTADYMVSFGKFISRGAAAASEKVSKLVTQGGSAHYSQHGSKSFAGFDSAKLGTAARSGFANHSLNRSKSFYDFDSIKQNTAATSGSAKYSLNESKSFPGFYSTTDRPSSATSGFPNYSQNRSSWWYDSTKQGTARESPPSLIIADIKKMRAKKSTAKNWTR